MSHYQDDWLTVHLGDCRAVMAAMEPESVHCVVTSPPYWGLRDYGEPGQLGLESTPEAYVESMVAVFREVRRVLRSDGTVWLNLGDSYASSGGERTYGSSDNGTGRGPGTRRHDVPASGLKPKDLVGIPWRVAFALQADGWYLRSDIIWSKPNPMPESVTDRPTKSHEYLFLLSKSPRYYFDADAVREGYQREYDTRTWDERKALGQTSGNREPDRMTMTTHVGHDLGGTQPGRNIRSVWSIATQPYPGSHFATFPQALVEPCIKAGTSERGVCPECGAPWERVVRRSDEYAAQSTRPGLHDLDRGAFREHLRERRAVMGLSRAAIDGALGTNTAYAWWEGRNYRGQFTQQVPTWDLYLRLKVVLDIDDRYDEAIRRVDQNSNFRFRTERLNEQGPAAQSAVPAINRLNTAQRSTTGWRPTCAHVSPRRPAMAVVLDPFAGSGTTGLVAQRLSRRAVLIDLNADYLGQVMDRNRDIPLGLGA